MKHYGTIVVQLNGKDSPDTLTDKIYDCVRTHKDLMFNNYMEHKHYEFIQTYVVQWVRLCYSHAMDPKYKWFHDLGEFKTSMQVSNMYTFDVVMQLSSC